MGMRSKTILIVAALIAAVSTTGFGYYRYAKKHDGVVDQSELKELAMALNKNGLISRPADLFSEDPHFRMGLIASLGYDIGFKPSKTTTNEEILNALYDMMLKGELPTHTQTKEFPWFPNGTGEIALAKR